MTLVGWVASWNIKSIARWRTFRTVYHRERDQPQASFLRLQIFQLSIKNYLGNVKQLIKVEFQPPPLGLQAQIPGRTLLDNAHPQIPTTVALVEELVALSGYFQELNYRKVHIQTISTIEQ